MVSPHRVFAALVVLAASACTFDPAPYVPDKDAGSGTRDGGVAQLRDGGTSNADGGTDDASVTDAGIIDGGNGPRDGGDPLRDGGGVPRDGGMAPRDGGMNPRDGGMLPRDGGAPRDGGPRFPFLSNLSEPTPAAGGSFFVAAGAECEIDTTNLTMTDCPANIPITSITVGAWAFAVVSVADATIRGDVVARGNRPLIILSDGEITVHLSGSIDVRGEDLVGGPGSGRTCVATNGPDGTRTGSGGGGGGHATAGGMGGAPQVETSATTPGGQTRASSREPLAGGCYGGDGLPGVNGGGRGGGGGGAVQLTSGLRIRVFGNISATGGGGEGGLSLADDGVNPPFPQGGGGGGAGGTVVLEAPMITISTGSSVDTRGGGGGQGGRPPNSAADGNDGEDGDTRLVSAANGGDDPGAGGFGGDGALGPGFDAEDGATENTGGSAGGGGGGGAGRLYLRANGCAVDVLAGLFVERIGTGPGCN